MIGLKRGFLKKYTEKHIKDDGKSLSGNGYVKLSNGLIIQWGFINTTSNPHIITLPIAFPNAILNIEATGEYTSYGNASIFVTKNSSSKSNFKLYTENYVVDAYWVAIGY